MGPSRPSGPKEAVVQVMKFKSSCGVGCPGRDRHATRGFTIHASCCDAPCAFLNAPNPVVSVCGSQQKKDDDRCFRSGNTAPPSPVLHACVVDNAHARPKSTHNLQPPYLPAFEKNPRSSSFALSARIEDPSADFPFNPSHPQKYRARAKFVLDLLMYTCVGSCRGPLSNRQSLKATSLPCSQPRRRDIESLLRTKLLLWSQLMFVHHIRPTLRKDVSVHNGKRDKCARVKKSHIRRFSWIMMSLTAAMTNLICMVSVAQVKWV
jgi:hypothetical protein